MVLPAPAVMEPHQAFLAHLLLMLVAAAVAYMLEQPEMAALAAVAQVKTHLRRRELLETTALLIQAVAVAVEVPLMQTVAPAAPASSFSNTKSQVPLRFLPSNLRRSGLHRLERSALTTSLWVAAVAAAALMELDRVVVVLAGSVQEPL